MTPTPPDPHHTNPHPADEVVPLHVTGETLLAEARTASAGRAAHTVVAIPGLRSTLIALAAGRELAEHQAPGAAILTCLAGRVRLTTGERDWAAMGEGDIVAIPDQRHRLMADTDALVLLTVRLD
ncbi:LuxR family transcriptional regulator [Streptomyces sp. H27-C3]|uniref:LuxR family transcriptional regulator n=1 Tax=Streptomyces sp. H27-C3 TaxID=3046305 RepID=UPI0024BA58DD|nr:LuxR family transcriptional regulator [Streptomyces sp. H27-C3]MDJ0465544.1 LuxR family transcriptional regulator [Streptomyces sp. H27-C3]